MTKHSTVFEGAYWDAQKVLDEALGTNVEDGAGGGLADEVRLLAAQRDTAQLENDRLRAEVEQLQAKLAGSCGSCHPCTNYADETWRAAGRTPPHVSQWDELRDEVAKRRLAVDRARAAVAPHRVPHATAPIELTVLAAAVLEALAWGEQS